jgi:hypothetical protein
LPLLVELNYRFLLAPQASPNISKEIPHSSTNSLLKLKPKPSLTTCKQPAAQSPPTGPWDYSCSGAYTYGNTAEINGTIHLLLQSAILFTWMRLKMMLKRLFSKELSTHFN